VVGCILSFDRKLKTQIPAGGGGIHEITGVKLYTLRSGETGERGASHGESQYWGGVGRQFFDLLPHVHLPEIPACSHPVDGAGQDPYVVEIETDEG